MEVIRVHGSGSNRFREGSDGCIGRASILPECPRECLFVHVHLVTNNFMHIYTYNTNITFLYILYPYYIHTNIVKNIGIDIYIYNTYEYTVI